MLFRKPRNPLSEDEWEWLLATLKWLESEFPDRAAGPLALPTADHFPVVSKDPAERATELFEHVRVKCGLEHVAVNLVAVQGQSGPPVPLSPAIASQKWSGAAGTFQIDAGGTGGNVPTITYAAESINEPITLIATFAHELAHLQLAYAPSCPPGGEECEEEATDFAAVWMGFGLFLAESAFVYTADNTQWGYRAQGYLNRMQLLTAMAIVAARSDHSLDPVYAAMSKHLAADLRKVEKFIATRDLGTEMDAIDLFEFGVRRA